jgi:hypothetical protein
LVVERYGYICRDADGARELLAFSDIPRECPWLTEMPKVEGAQYSFETARIHVKPEKYAELMSALDDDGFVCKVEYNAAREYLKRLKAERASTAGYFEGLL